MLEALRNDFGASKAPAGLDLVSLHCIFPSFLMNEDTKAVLASRDYTGFGFSKLMRKKYQTYSIFSKVRAITRTAVTGPVLLAIGDNNVNQLQK